MKYTKRLIILIITFLCVFSQIYATKSPAQMQETFELQEKLLEYPKYVLSALKKAYPETINYYSYHAKEKDWVIVTFDNKKYYWAKGRLLPQTKRHDWQKYKAYVFYYYPETFIHPEFYPKKYIEKLSSSNFKKERLVPIDYEYSFFNSLYGGSTRKQIEQNIVSMNFLGYKINVHKIVVQPLKRVEKEILKLNKTDQETIYFFKTLRSIFGYNWRLIGDTQRKSNHCWGTAIDILPKNWKKKKIYWMWERSFNKNWFMVPKKSRWCPPDSIVQIFENEGFIWGGKWDLWDNMHFEYRPELLTLQDEYQNFINSKK